MEVSESSRHEISSGVGADSRRAIWLDALKTLVISDTHFGQAWVDRARGHLSPLADGEMGLRRLRCLFQDYQPSRLVITGDVVHASARLKVLEETLRELDQLCGQSGVELHLILGNHDRGLDQLVVRLGLNAHLERSLTLGRFRFVHGDVELSALDGTPSTELSLSNNDEPLVLFGHEHPCILLRGAGARSARCPCFLIGPGKILLPAFSDRAAGCEISKGRFLGPIAQTSRFVAALLCIGPRLLQCPYPLPPEVGV
jgi:putative SbcD/Mre11-related phosphoesterase